MPIPAVVKPGPIFAACLALAAAAGAQTAPAPAPPAAPPGAQTAAGEPPTTEATPVDAPALDAPPGSLLGATDTPSAPQDEPLDRLRNDHDWTIRFEPAVWLVSPSGVVQLPGASSDSARIEELNLDTPEVRPSGEVHLAADPWRLSFFGSQYAQHTDFVAETGFTTGDVDIAPGDTADVDFDFTMVEVDAGYLVWRHDFDAGSFNQANTIDADVSLYAIGGVRAYDIDFDVREVGGQAGRSSTDQFFAEPIVGLRGELDLLRDFTVDVQLTGGGYFDSDRSSGSLDIVVGFQWRPHPNVGVQIGWRQVAYWLNDGEGEDEFEYNGRMAGIQGGLVIRF